MTPDINISNLVKGVPHAQRHNNIGKVSRHVFVFATCVGSQFSTAATPVRLSLLEERPTLTLTGVVESPINDIEIPGIITRPEYQTLLRLEKIEALDSDWDGYDSPAISKKAIKNTLQAIQYFNKDVFTHLQVWPNEYGGVLIRYRNGDHTVFCCDFGDTCMSYYIDLPGEKPREYVFVEYNDAAFKALAKCIAEVRRVVYHG